MLKYLLPLAVSAAAFPVMAESNLPPQRWQADLFQDAIDNKFDFSVVASDDGSTHVQVLRERFGQAELESTFYHADGSRSWGQIDRDHGGNDSCGMFLKGDLRLDCVVGEVSWRNGKKENILIARDVNTFAKKWEARFPEVAIHDVAVGSRGQVVLAATFEHWGRNDIVWVEFDESGHPYADFKWAGRQCENDNDALTHTKARIIDVDNGRMDVLSVCSDPSGAKTIFYRELINQREFHEVAREWLPQEFSVSFSGVGGGDDLPYVVVGSPRGQNLLYVLRRLDQQGFPPNPWPAPGFWSHHYLEDRQLDAIRVARDVTTVVYRESPFAPAEVEWLRFGSESGSLRERVVARGQFSYSHNELRSHFSITPEGDVVFLSRHPIPEGVQAMEQTRLMHMPRPHDSGGWAPNASDLPIAQLDNWYLPMSTKFGQTKLLLTPDNGVVVARALSVEGQSPRIRIEKFAIPLAPWRNAP